MIVTDEQRRAKRATDRYVRQLRAAGWRVRCGSWGERPPVRPERWDFCRYDYNSLWPMNPDAYAAVDALCTGRPIPVRQESRQMVEGPSRCN